MSELRFVPKKQGEGRTAHWRVYDRLRGSYPIRRPDLPGMVLEQHYTEKEATEIAQKLTDLAGYMPEGGRPKTPVASKTPAPQPDIDDAEADVEDDGEQGDEDH